MILLIRIIKSGLSLAMGLIVSIITLNNLTDYQSNYEFVKQVMRWIQFFQRASSDGGRSPHPRPTILSIRVLYA